MMDEMAKTLARRRAAAEKQDGPVNQQQQDDSAERKVGRMNGGPSSSSLTGTNGDSPRSTRKRSGSSSEDVGQRVSGSGGSNAVDGGSSMDFEALKEELVREMRQEMNKIKQEIIEGKPISRL